MCICVFACAVYMSFIQYDISPSFIVSGIFTVMSQCISEISLFRQHHLHAVHRCEWSVTTDVAHNMVYVSCVFVCWARLQGGPVKNSSIEKMWYFSHGSTDLSQTFRLRM